MIHSCHELHNLHNMSTCTALHTADCNLCPASPPRPCVMHFNSLHFKRQVLSDFWLLLAALGRRKSLLMQDGAIIVVSLAAGHAELPVGVAR